MSQLKRPDKVEDVGLERFLNETSLIHNDLDYKTFVGMVGADPDKPKVDKANLARAFSVHRTTIYRWLEIYKKEQPNGS